MLRGKGIFSTVIISTWTEGTRPWFLSFSLRRFFLRGFRRKKLTFFSEFFSPNLSGFVVGMWLDIILFCFTLSSHENYVVLIMFYPWERQRFVSSYFSIDWKGTKVEEQHKVHSFHTTFWCPSSGHCQLVILFWLTPAAPPILVRWLGHPLGLRGRGQKGKLGVRLVHLPWKLWYQT